MSNGTRQDERLADTLRPDHVLPDEIGLAERVRITLAQAASLRFGAGADRWDTALRQDESVVLAEVATFPLPRLEQEFVAALDREGEAALWARIWRLVRTYDGWCWWLAGREGVAGSALGEALLAQIEQGLAGVVTAGRAAFGLPGGGADDAPLHPVWLRPDSAARVTPLTGAPAPDDRRARRQWLRRAWLALTLAIQRLQPQAQALFERSLGGGRHEPAMGLLLATLQLFQYSRAPLNRFPERLIDFYYRDVLRLSPRPGLPEHVHLLLEREPRHRGIVPIAAGTRFVGGKDAQGQVLTFAADGPLELTGTRVVALCTQRVERDPLISPEREFDFATRLKVEELPLQAPDAAYVDRPAWWPLLGGTVRGSASLAQDALLGFALASPLLRLKEGKREIRVRLQFAHPAANDESLVRALRTSRAQRDVAWLTDAFRAYAAYEAQHFPGRPRPGGAAPALDPETLAQAAWKRAPAFEADVQLAFLVAACLACDDAAVFAERLGRLFAVWMVAGDEQLRLVDLQALRAHAAALRGQDGAGEGTADIRDEPRVEIDDPLILIYPPLNPGAEAALPERDLIFERVFASVWQARLSTATGWLTVDKVFTHRRAPASDTWGGGMELVLRLGADQPPVVPCISTVHGVQWPAQAMLQMAVQTRGRLYAFSLLGQYALSEINLTVNVDDLRDVVLYNQLGRLDPSKPFLPFGPTPMPGGYLVFGSQELACKPLQLLHLSFNWANLPDLSGGFPEHYARYPGDWRASGFRLGTAVLTDGQWRNGNEALLPMFSTVHGRERLLREHRLVFPGAALRRLHRATPPRPAAQPFLYGLGSRNGFFRLDLAEPPTAFGHGLYPTLLSTTLTRNTKLKRPAALPREPYTPTLQGLALHYQSTQDIRLVPGDGSDADQSLLQRAYHLYPYGIAAMVPQHGQPPGLLPRHAGDGNLFIGLSGDDLQGTLSLFFHLRREEAAERWGDAVPELHWATWQDGHWQPLAPHMVLSDGTQGLLRSGIVQLNLPAGMTANCASLPGACYWLRLGADWGFTQLAGLYGVHAQAITATRTVLPESDQAPIAVPPGTINMPGERVPGLRAVVQVGPADGWRAADRPEAVRMRGAERLRHKLRAVTRWDYERLLLDAFPAVFKARCFAHHEATLIDPAGRRHQHLANLPGQVLLAVVPHPQPGELFRSTEAPRFDAALLEAMRAHLQACAPAGARVLVRNAAYERAQVRCILRLVSGSHPGAMLRQLNQALVEYLSPWHADGIGADFDWSVRADTLEAFLRAQPGVDAVGKLSMLHIVRNDRQFNVLHDTATHTIRGEARTLRPAQPWSLLLPTRRHLLELHDDIGPLVPHVTGIRRLEVGSTFIVGRAAPNPSAQVRDDQ
ncbi:hypothetical protein [Cupriavidus sp. DL-D2]|uniref:hypothetical protein n=1 Tax=Cupriavidus sp. DL-D2 TaxID=3144974 RepID=UPI0032133044